MAEKRRLGIGFAGAGFVTRFHIRSLVGVRNADVAAIAGPTRGRAESAADLAHDLGLGRPKTFASVAEMAKNPAVDAIWICVPNDARVPVTEEIVDAVKQGAELIGLACEKPLARNVGEARRMLNLIRGTQLLHGYLENQAFAPSLTRGKEIIWRRAAALSGRPYLARASEEHSGPHMPWFWSGARQGGGVLNDMLCHSFEAARFLLTAPGESRSSVVVNEVSAQIASLKWTRPEYAGELLVEMGTDYKVSPAEDFARATVKLSAGGQPAIVEASTSWNFVGPGLRLRMELFGPEYSMQVDTLHSDLSLFLSRRISGSEGEDLVEKQNAEQGLMPVIADEASTYGYTAENRHMVECFLAGRQPEETWEDGIEVTRVLMACYLSAERGSTVTFPDPELETFVPAVARGAWRP
jgi:predicted dehydrogenase